jgi:hypothetical protein
VASWPAAAFSRQRAAAGFVDSNQFVLKKLAATLGQFGRPRCQYRNFGFATAGASATKGNPFLPLAISILRLFGNEDRHSKRSPRLHMVRVLAV